MGNVVGRGVKVEIGMTETTPGKAVTAVSKADPAVVTAAAHGLAAGVVGYFSGVQGMVQLEGQAGRVANPVSGSFDAIGIDSAKWPDFTNAAVFIPVASWGTYAAATNYAIGGGEGSELDATRLIDDISQVETGLLAAQSVTFGALAEDAPSAVLEKIRKAARNSDYLVVRITLKSGAQRIFRGQPSMPGEDVQKGQLGTGSLSFKVKGEVLFLPAVAA